VDHILTQDALKKKIAKEIFAGKYKVLMNDTLSFGKEIIFDSLLNVSGIKNILRYNFENEIDIDFPLDNIFYFIDTADKEPYYDYYKRPFSFQFKGDTLLLNDYKILRNEGGDVIGFKITNPRIKLLKIK